MPQPDGPTSDHELAVGVWNETTMASKPFGKTLRMPCRVTDAIAPVAYWPDTIEAKPRSSCFWMPAKIATTGAVPMRRHEHQALPVDVPLADVHEDADP